MYVMKIKYIFWMIYNAFGTDLILVNSYESS